MALGGQKIWFCARYDIAHFCTSKFNFRAEWGKVDPLVWKLDWPNLMNLA